MGQEARVAIEALRAGVPNGAAIRLLGSPEEAISAAFVAGLEGVWGKKPKPGLMFSGGFGCGKSHLLGFLREEALARNFVVSRVTVSKETPLSQPGAVFSAAMRDTVVPGRVDDAVAVALAELQRRPGAVQDLESWARTPGSGLAPIFAAVTGLLSRDLVGELMQGIEAFLCGGKPPSAPVRSALASLGMRGMFDLSAVKAAALQAQRPRYVAQLFRAAGFAGWCILFDEVELIGRYGPAQRAMAYAELGRWLGLEAGGKGIAGVHVAGAITDDFADEVINGRQDDEKLPERLRNKGLEPQAALAVAAMQAIRSCPVLAVPGAEELAQTAAALQRCYSDAYGWAAPEAAPAERRANRTMRHHVRGWITQWDMLRLRGRRVAVNVSALASDYSEDAALGMPAADDDEAG